MSETQYRSFQRISSPDPSPTPPGSPQPTSRAVEAISMASKRPSSSDSDAHAVQPLEYWLAEYLKNGVFVSSIPLDQDQIAMLQRWLEDGRANEVWSTIRGYSEKNNASTGPGEPIAFIKYVLVAKKRAVLEDKAAKERPFAEWRFNQYN